MEKSKLQNLFSKKSESLNDMIINYYHRFGKNRDLEKYLRFRRHYTGIKPHSSSESSLLSNLSNRNHFHQLSGDHEQTSSKSLGSLEQLLSIKNSLNNSSKQIAFATSRSDGDDDSKKGSHNTYSDKQITQTDEEEGTELLTGRQKITVDNFKNSPPKINIKNIKRQLESANNKAFTFNCESNIEITIPSFPVQPTTVSMPNLLTNSEMLAVTEGSQTDFDEFGKLISPDKLTVLPEVNEEEIKTPRKNIIKNSATKSISPDSHVKSSIHKRLEWDSLGDVGYNTRDKTPTKDQRKSTSISTLEKSVLKDFFAERGFALSFPSLTSKSVKNETKTPDKSSSQGAIPKKRPVEEKWRKTLASVQQKYNSSPILLSRQKAVYQSTDVEPPHDQTNSFLKDLSSNRHSTQIETPRVSNLEQFCQTSLVKTECREVQCDFSNGSSIRSAYEIGSMTSQSSFEYHSKTNTSDSNKENVPLKLKTTLPSSEESRRKKYKNSSGEKELSPRKSSVDFNKQNEVELGIQLLCSLIEAKNLNERQKKILIKKIIAKIANKNIDSLNSITVTGTTQSYNNSTNSKASSIITSALIQSLDKKNSTNTENIQEISNLSETKPNKKDNKLIDKSCITSPTLMDQWKNSEIDQKENLIKSKDSSKSSLKEQSDKPKNLQTNEEKLIKKESLRTRRTVTETSEDVSQISPDLITMREWLDPITKSEFTYEEKNKLKNLNGNRKHKFIDQQKKKHFQWIEKEIKRLENLKNAFQTETESTSSIKESSNAEQDNNSKMIYGEKRLYDTVASPKYIDLSEDPFSNSNHANYIIPHNNYDVSTTNALPTNFRSDNERYPSKFSCNCNPFIERNSYLYDKVNPYSELRRERRLPNEPIPRFRSKLETPTSSNHDNDCLLHALKKRREFIKKYINQEPPYSHTSFTYPFKTKREFIDKYLNHQKEYEAPETHYSNPKDSPPIQQTSANMNYPSTSYASSPSMSIRFASGGIENSKERRPSINNENSYKHDRSRSCCESSKTSKSFFSSTSHNKNSSSLKDKNNFITPNDLDPATRATFEYCNKNLDAVAKKKSIAYIITFKEDDSACIERKKKSSCDIQRSNSSPLLCSSDIVEKDYSSIRNEHRDNSSKFCSDEQKTYKTTSSEKVLSRQSSGGTCCEETQPPPVCNENSKNSVSRENFKNDTRCEVTMSDDDDIETQENKSKKCVKINCERNHHHKNKRREKRSKSQETTRKQSDAHITIEIITRKESFPECKETPTSKPNSQICIEPIVPPPPCPANNKQQSSTCIPTCPDRSKKKSSMAKCSEKQPMPCEVDNNTSNDCSNICPDKCSEPVTPPCKENKKKKNEPKPKIKKCPCKEKRKCYCKEVDSNECLTLQDHYKRNCPDFFAKAMERQCKLNELQKLRKQRGALMHKIVENHSCTTIFRKLKQLPPPAATQVKIFSSKEKKTMTNRNHRNLPETIEKCEVLRREKEKCGNQILRGIFNQRMQKRVRQGKLSLQPSRTII